MKLDEPRRCPIDDLCLGDVIQGTRNNETIYGVVIDLLLEAVHILWGQTGQEDLLWYRSNSVVTRCARLDEREFAAARSLWAEECKRASRTIFGPLLTPGATDREVTPPPEPAPEERTRSICLDRPTLNTETSPCSSTTPN